MNYLILIRTLIVAIKTVESLMPDSPGKEKFDAAIAIVEGVVGSVTDKLPVLQSLATDVVNALRLAGVFKAKA